MSTFLRIVGVVLFVVAAASAFVSGVNLNELGFIAAGLACWCASTLVG